MKRSKRNFRNGRNRQAGTALLCLLGFTSAGKAQQVLSAPPAYSLTPPAVQAEQNEHMGTLSGGAGNFSLPGPSDLLEWGPVNVRPHLLYRALYGDGIQSTPGQQSKTFIQQFSPGVTFGIGSHWNLDYTPTLIYYSSKQFHDTLDQNVTLTGGTSYEDWIFGLMQGYSSASDPLVETGTQTSTENYTTALNASYRINSVMSLDFSVNQKFNSAQQFTSSRTWSTMEYLNYQFWPRLNVGVGAGFEYDNVSVGPDMTAEQFQVRVNWRALDKLSLVVHGGGEDRQFRGGGVSDTISPVFGVAISYQPFEFTSLSLSADRSISPSYFQSQAAQTTTVGVTFTQRLLKKFTLTAGGAYTQVSYLASAANVASGRMDDYYSLSTRLSWEFLKRATAALSYQYSVNTSTTPGFTFNSSQIGLELGYRF